MINMKEIHFTKDDLPLSEYESLQWNLNETRSVEFFPNKLISVTLISTEIPNFEEHLNRIDDLNPIALDLEWEDELCLFQFCSSNGVLIVRHPNGQGNELLKKFLSTHSFFAKGASNDKKQLMLKFGKDFHENIEDISLTRLKSYGHSENFIQMTIQFAGTPTADFKDIRITTSNWSQKVLTMRQVLYAAFDVVAIYECYPNFPPPNFHTHKKSKALQSQNKKSRQLNKQKLQQKMNQKKLNKDESQSNKNNEKIKVTMKMNEHFNAFCYLATNYQGSTKKADLYKLLEFIPTENINFISSYPETNKTSVIFISLFVKIDIQAIPIPNIVELPFVDPEESSDGDFLYLTNLPKRISERRELNIFLNCFEIDHRLVINDNYARIEVCCAESSHILKCFISHITIDGVNPILWDFPYFLNSIQVRQLPSFWTDNECKQLFERFGEIDSIRELKRRSNEDHQSFVVKFKDFESSTKAINEINYSEIDGNEILVSRFSEEQPMRIIRRYELTISSIDTNEENGTNELNLRSSRDLRKEFSPFGAIYQAFYDQRLKTGHVQFFHRKSALKAQQAMNKIAYFPPDGSTIIIRDISYKMTQNEIIEMCEVYGKVINFVVRLIVEKFRYQIVEVTFSSADEAMKAKSGLDNRRIDNIPIVVSVYRGAGCEVPMWKMEQRFQWIVIENNMLNENETEIIDENSIHMKLSKLGIIIDFRIYPQKTFVMFYDPRSAEAANEELGTRMPTLEEFANETNNRALQTEVFIPFRNPTNEAQQYAIVLDPMPDEFCQQTLNQYCPKCFYTLAVLRSSINQDQRRAIIYCDGQKMTKKIFALIRDQKCGNETMKPEIMKKENVPNTVTVSPISIIIDPLPDELLGNRIKTNILMDKEASVDIMQSVIDKKKMMAVVLPKRREDCKTILRAFRRWRVDGLPLNVKKIINYQES
ncbi:hypothetical protein TRFO_08369 [Tritrichomonas foetus]|uniref:RRM domain-containing protein n=1 Tax=Tritrichomonas foetus TaxID=1144522 RepID=A0A1J4JJV8_9EUKA|nr:hypothetical protein TRFO_08369 [Tritrichomonas foetus]|eukprot:OHS99442.1 hypothetical protein TRFO_08369 [Tritrichomonas foetus]